MLFSFQPEIEQDENPPLEPLQRNPDYNPEDEESDEGAREVEEAKSTDRNSGKEDAQRIADGLYETFDENKDGKLSLDEFLSSIERKPEAEEEDEERQEGLQAASEEKAESADMPESDAHDEL